MPPTELAWTTPAQRPAHHISTGAHSQNQPANCRPWRRSGPCRGSSRPESAGANGAPHQRFALCAGIRSARSGTGSRISASLCAPGFHLVMGDEFFPLHRFGPQTQKPPMASRQATDFAGQNHFGAEPLHLGIMHLVAFTKGVTVIRDHLHPRAAGEIGIFDIRLAGAKRKERHACSSMLSRFAGQIDDPHDLAFKIKIQMTPVAVNVRQTKPLPPAQPGCHLQALKAQSQQPSSLQLLPPSRVKSPHAPLLSAMRSAGD